MATVLQLQFPGGRYHATPWGHHVNEGLVEWPPSPWRLLRALLATGFTKAGWDPSGPPEIARKMLESLAGTLPAYILPRVALAHSRHYVDAAGKKPLILDTWARVDGPIEVQWKVELDADSRKTLADLAGLLGYLGRAESWVTGRLADGPSGPPNCFPVEAEESRDLESIRVLCPQSASQYLAWRQKATAEIEARLPLPVNKKPLAKLLKDRLNALGPYPADLIAALCADTGWLQKHGWSAAPGSQQKLYWRRLDALEVSPPKRLHKNHGASVPLALLALATPSRNQSALPTVERTFSQGRLLHRAIAATVGRLGERGVALRLLGKDGQQVARHDHKHVHLLHLDLDGNGRLNHVLVWAPSELDADIQRVLRGVQRTWRKGEDPLQVALAGLGQKSIFLQRGNRFESSLRLTIGTSKVWETATPFVAPRLTKKRGKDSLEGQIQEGLARRGFPPATEIILLDRKSDLALSFRRFILHDKTHEPPVRIPHAVRLVFDEAVSGPLCLGYGSHFGLGRFQAYSAP